MSPTIRSPQNTSMSQFATKVKTNFYFRGIYHYSTTNTAEAVFIIGGHHTGNIVAEFRDDRWQQVATLKQGRSRHGSITFGGQTVIIGGAYGQELASATINPE